MTFGVTCSPYVAISTTWRAADDSGLGMEEDTDAVRRNLYMYDYLDSTKDLTNASKRAKAVIDVLANGDFHLGHWSSNDSNLLDIVQSVRLGRGKRGDIGKGMLCKVFYSNGAQRIITSHRSKDGRLCHWWTRLTNSFSHHHALILRERISLSSFSRRHS